MDSEIGLVHIENGEGGKGRYTILSQSALKALKSVLGQHRAFRVIQAILKRAYKKASIEEIVSLHSLGYSFAKTFYSKNI